MSALNPVCQFYGADPIQEYGSIYSDIGTYFEIAVGAESGVLNASVKNGPGAADYTWKVVPVIDLSSFLLNYVNKSIIDHLWIDNEGPEYRMLPLLQRKGDLDRKGITVCQLNVEMHWPFLDYGFDEEQFGRMILDFAEKSDFVLMKLHHGAPSHYRAFFFNAFDPYCVHRYFGDRC
uniref:Methyltransferase FkbM domain-containing protein n=1 Tax=Plectus sambesii TaxID=2011161 RepID=A0A914WCE8_9BILA